uniref:Uncharacterized protein n=1 Tax=Plectus sambesii TaxID=2011161 RepID=A0A914W0A7_9BILA
MTKKCTVSQQRLIVDRPLAGKSRPHFWQADSPLGSRWYSADQREAENAAERPLSCSGRGGVTAPAAAVVTIEKGDNAHDPREGASQSLSPPPQLASSESEEDVKNLNREG